MHNPFDHTAAGRLVWSGNHLCAKLRSLPSWLCPPGRPREVKSVAPEREPAGVAPHGQLTSSSKR